MNKFNFNVFLLISIAATSTLYAADIYHGGTLKIQSGLHVSVGQEIPAVVLLNNQSKGVDPTKYSALFISAVYNNDKCSTDNPDNYIINSNLPIYRVYPTVTLPAQSTSYIGYDALYGVVEQTLVSGIGTGKGFDKWTNSVQSIQLDELQSIPGSIKIARNPLCTDKNCYSQPQDVIGGLNLKTMKENSTCIPITCYSDKMMCTLTNGNELEFN